ncbi:MAG: hypothetical protein QM725_14175 [Lacibacter sp.]
MKNKIKIIIITIAIFCWQLPTGIVAQVKTNDSSLLSLKTNTEELKVRQRGGELQFSFPRLQFKSALKIVNANGWMMKAIMVDEGLETITVSTSNLPKGIYQCVIENRTQKFMKKLFVQ